MIINTHYGDATTLYIFSIKVSLKMQDILCCFVKFRKLEVLAKPWPDRRMDGRTDRLTDRPELNKKLVNRCL